jgi:hypothetical protein
VASSRRRGRIVSDGQEAGAKQLRHKVHTLSTFLRAAQSGTVSTVQCAKGQCVHGIVRSLAERECGSANAFLASFVSTQGGVYGNRNSQVVQRRQGLWLHNS